MTSPHANRNPSQGIPSANFRSSSFQAKVACPICKGAFAITNAFFCARCSCAYGISPFPVFIEDSWCSEPAKKGVQEHYLAIDQSLERAGTAAFSSFMNYGYLPNSNSRHARFEPPRNTLNRNSVRLLFEVIGSLDIREEDVLEVGCGRGGNLITVVEHFNPRVAIGLDITRAFVAHCNHTHRKKGLWFCVGDAEHLPLGNNTFGVVINIESSHSYPNVGYFFNEVYRVLRPCGHFVYSDAIEIEAISAYKAAWTRLGFRLLHEADITANVLLSCDQIASYRKNAYSSYASAFHIDDYLGAPGSVLYNRMRDGAVKYMSFTLSKDAVAC